MSRTAWATAAIAVLAFALGLVGYLQLGGMSVATAVYSTLSLFTLGFTLPPGTDASALPVALEVARFLAPVVTVLAAVGIAARIFRDQLDLVTARRAKGHVIVCGLGRVGLATSQRLAEEGHPVVAIERDASAAGIATARAQRIPVIVGDASDQETLKRAGVERAGRLVWSANEWVHGQSVVDGLEREIATARGARDERHAWESVPTCLVRVRDLALCTALRRQVLAHDWRESGVGPDVDFFNEAENAAQRLLWKVTRGYALDAGRTVELWVLGGGALAEAIVVQAARNWWGARPRPTLVVHLFGEDAGRIAGRITATWPEISAACRLVAHPGPPEAAASERAGRAAANDDPDAAFVLVEGEDRAVQIGLRLLDETSTPHVVIAAAGRYGSRIEQPRLLLFDPGSYGLGSEALLFDTYELLGRLIHEHYDLAHSLNDDGTLDADANPMGTHREWGELDELWRSSSRDAARFVVPNLREAGLTVRRMSPTPDAACGAWKPELDDRRVDEMAQREHERWRKYMTAHGYTLGPERSDAPPALTRPGLVPWSTAPEHESDREYTRTQVREYPRLLAQLGYEIRPS